jgi:hypothetical protein
MDAIDRVKAKVVIVNVLIAYLPSQTNTYRDQDVRLALAPLAQMADRKAWRCICIQHLKKMPGANPLYRGGGSIRIIGGARAGLLVERDPDNENLCVFAQTQNNLATFMPSLSFKIEENGAGAPFTAWKGESPQTAVLLLAATGKDREEGGAVAEAIDFLRGELKDGKRSQRELLRAARDNGISGMSLRRLNLRWASNQRKTDFIPDGIGSFRAKVIKHLQGEDDQRGLSTFGEGEKSPEAEGFWGKKAL